MRVLSWAFAVLLQVAVVSSSRNDAAAGATSRHSELLSSLTSYEVVHLEELAHDVSHHHESTLSTANKHPLATSFTVRGLKRTMEVELTRYDALFHPEYYESLDTFKDGQKLGSQRTELSAVPKCHYRGKAKHTHDDQNAAQGPVEGMVAMHACGPHGGFTGVLQGHNGEFFSLAPAAEHLPTAHLEQHAQRIRHTLSTAGGDASSVEPANLHVLYHAKDFDMPHAECGVSDDEQIGFEHFLGHLNGEHDHDHDHDHAHASGEEGARRLATKIDGLQSRIKHTLNDDPTTRWIEFLVVNDVSRKDEKGISTTTDSAHLANLVDLLYSVNNTFTPPVRLILVAQHTMAEEDPWAASTPLDANNEVDHTVLITEFHEWRSKPGMVPAHDNGHLFSSLDFKGDTVGYAGVNAMCRELYSGGINEMKFSDPWANAAVVAHELGHNFGMFHDSTSGNTCPSSGFIMNAVLASVPHEFSSCSEEYYNAFTYASCLSNKPDSQWSSGVAVCGNGWVETGEQCDCGNAASCKDECCDADTCMLKGSATCANSDACCEGCQIVSSTEDKVCRANTSECDLVEKCDGFSPKCPMDGFKGAGVACQKNDPKLAGQCFGGLCMSHASACKDMAQFFGSNFDVCPNNNNKDFCGTMFCADQGTQGTTNCKYFPAAQNSAEFTTMPDGTPCPDGETQCLKGACVKGGQMNPNYYWVQSDWSSCSTCSEKQYTSTKCMARLADQSVMEATNPELCSPEFRYSQDSRPCYNLTLGCVHDSEDTELHTVAREWAEKYGAMDKAAQLRALIPRFYGPTEFDPANTEYWIGIVVVGAPFMLIGLLVVLFFLYHCSTGKGCGGNEAAPQGYSGAQRYLPWLVLMCLIVVSMAFAALALFYNGEIKRSVTDQNVGVVVVLDRMMGDAITTASNLLQPLGFIASNGTLIASEVLTQVDSTYQTKVFPIQTSLATLGNQVSDVGTQLDMMASPTNFAFTYSNGSFSIACAKCGVVGGGVAEVSTAVSAASTGTFSQVRGVVMDAKNGLASYKDALAAASTGILAETRDNANELYTFMTEKQALVELYKSKVYEGESYRHPFVLVLFLIPFAYGAFVFGGPICHALFGCSRYMAWALCLIMWILVGVHLALAATFGDSCEYMDSVELKLSSGTMFDEASKNAVMQACLGDTSLIAALNATDSFVLPPNADLATLPTVNYNFSSLADLSSAVQNLTAADFGIDNSTADNMNGNLTYVNAQTGNSFTIENLTSFNATAESTAVKLAVDTALAIYSATLAAGTAIQEVKADVAMMVASSATINTGTREALVALQVSAAKMSPLANAARSVVDAAYCGQIGANYELFKMSWCDSITTGFSFLSLSMFMIALFSGPFIYLSLMLAKRFRPSRDSHKKGKRERGFHHQNEMTTVDRTHRKKKKRQMDG